MKKQILTSTAILFFAVAALLTSCKKDNNDTIAPVINVTGGVTSYCQLNKSYTDLDATATDETDGSVSVTHTGTVNTSVLGTYTITYNAKDAAGNKATATRTVYVVQFDGTYTLVQSNCTDTTANGQGASIVSASGVTAANGMSIGNFGFYSANNLVASFSASAITVARQASATGVAGDKIEGAGTISGNGSVSNPIKLTFQIKEVDGAGATFNQGTATFTHN